VSNSLFKTFGVNINFKVNSF